MCNQQNRAFTTGSLTDGLFKEESEVIQKE